ncbi:MAG: protease complex subunit PrcB family protein [Fimbriimonas sp.]
MKIARVLLLLSLLLSFASALAQIGQESTWGRANMIDWRTFKSGTASRYNAQEMFVLNTENDFLNYWPKAMGSPALSAPEGVDWIKYRLVAVHLGSRPTSGYGIFVQNIVRDGAFATVHAVEETPLPDQYVAKVPCSPWVIVKVERSAVSFKLQMSSRQARPAIILGPGGTYIGPGDNDGAGWVDPRYQCDWGTYQTGYDSYIENPEMFVINTEVDFQNYYAKAFGQRPPRAGIDWYRYRLVAVHIGARRTTGFGVTVRNVKKNGVYGTIVAVEETPIPGQFVSRVETSPYVIVRVERGVVQFTLDMTAKQAKSGIVIIGKGGRGG